VIKKHELQEKIKAEELLGIDVVYKTREERFGLKPNTKDQREKLNYMPQVIRKARLFNNEDYARNI
jgi:hypothetical protein